ncbi:conjugative transfer relaxase protein TraI [Ruegeria denitrificans]|uniref:Conjugative transfer relaxase protein TraI n=1 Tax=Ruegeria denitrificans TaxID=1715692 RepID=A0A0P1I7M3_9RHOB|nr:toprim domain-containing protein [Ruegeria denitrificans]CUJ95572.1 conjugative transfer relaxase protein TraI [Ruegeria denitrificans]
MRDAETITQALGGRWSGRSGIACCPAHDDRSPSLSIANGHSGQLLLTCHAGCSFVHVLEALKGLGLAGSQEKYAPLSSEVVRKNREEERRQTLRRAEIAQSVWKEAQPVCGTPGETYLRKRGITCPLPSSLRYLDRCWHPAAKQVPALIGYVGGTDTFAVHRTYLRIDGAGKTDLSPSKAMLGATKGGAVQLSNAPGRLVVTEGIETGLSLLSGLMHGPIEVWAALSASGMKSLYLPEHPGELVIAPDGDAVGREAAQVLAHRAYALGWHVSLLPAPDGYDWNDVLMGKAKAQ